MSGLTPKKKAELKQMMGKYSGKVCLSLLSLMDRKMVIVSTEESLEDINCINWSDDVLSGKKKVLICGCEDQSLLGLLVYRNQFIEFYIELVL